MATIQSDDLVVEPVELPIIEPGPGDSFTEEPAFPDALKIIARVRAAAMEADLLAEGYRHMSADLREWSEISIAVQAETLPDE